MEKIQIFYQTGSSTPKNTVILYDSTKENPYIRDMVLKRGRGSVSSLTFVIEPTGGVQIPIPNKDRIYVRVGDPGEDIFIGYCIGIEKNFDTELTIICEHIAGRFNDIALSEIRLRKQLKVGDEVYTNTTIFHNETCYILGNTLGSQLTKLQNYLNKINGSNNYWLTGSSSITGKKPIKLDFERGTAMELINAIADKVGSIVNFGFNGGPQASFAPKNYSGTATENPIEFGVNLLDLQNNYNYNPVATHLIPYGAYWKDSDYALVGTDDVDDWHRIDLKFVASEHSDIISRQMYRDIDGAYKYVYAIEGDTSTSEGFIFAEMVFDDALNAEDLYTEAKAYLQSLTAAQTVQIRAVDLSGTGDYAPGKMVNIISPEHGISGRMQIQESEMHLGEPEKDEVTIGTTASITTGSNPVSNQAMGQIINQIRTDGIGGGGSDVSLDGVVKTIMIGGVAYDVATGTHTVSLPDYPEVPTDYVPLSGGAMDTGATLSFSAQFEDGTTEVTYFGDCVNFKDSRTEADVNLYYPDDEDGNQIFATRSFVTNKMDDYLPLDGGTVTGNIIYQKTDDVMYVNIGSNGVVVNSDRRYTSGQYMAYYLGDKIIRKSTDGDVNLIYPTLSAGDYTFLTTAGATLDIGAELMLKAGVGGQAGHIYLTPPQDQTNEGIEVGQGYQFSRIYPAKYTAYNPLGQRMTEVSDFGIFTTADVKANTDYSGNGGVSLVGVSKNLDDNGITPNVFDGKLLQGSRYNRTSITYDIGWVTSENTFPCNGGDKIYVSSSPDCTTNIVYIDTNGNYIKHTQSDTGATMVDTAPSNATNFYFEINKYHVRPDTAPSFTVRINNEIAELKSLLESQYKLLWSNPNDAAAMQNTEISVDCSKYNLFLIVFNIDTNRKNYSSVIAIKGVRTQLVSTSDVDIKTDGNFITRAITISDSKISIGNGGYVNSSHTIVGHTNCAVPKYVYGIA